MDNSINKGEKRNLDIKLISRYQSNQNLRKGRKKKNLMDNPITLQTIIHSRIGWI
jgi:hypothetical protein